MGRGMKWLVSFLAPFVLAACAASQSPRTAEAPAAPAAPRQIFAATAHPMATQAALAVLRRGGSAVDAAIAAQAMLSLVEPQSSGLGGGAFMTYFSARDGRVTVYDGRETAPAGASPRMFLDADGKPISPGSAITGGIATGVPGVVRMLKLAHDEQGKLAWSSLFGDAERAATDGFPVSPRLGRFAQGGRFPQAGQPDVVAYFTKADGSRYRTGDMLRNPAYAAFLKRLAARGPDALYAGQTARAIVAKTTSGSLPGAMTLSDLAGYRAIRREALCGPYRLILVCVPPPPSSGVGLLQLLAMLERTDIAARGPGDPQAWYLFAEASRVMYADRDAWVGDVPDVPVTGMLDPAYVASRAALIGPRAGPPPAAGTPPGAPAPKRDATAEPGGTSHFVLVDRWGNAVSMTTTVESIFGSGRMVDGFFLNNQMTDFSFLPSGPNAVGPGKRPRSSMTPAILLDGQGKLAGAIGSPGGNSILAYVGKAIVGAAAWKLPMTDAIALPNLVARGANFNAEADRFAPGVVDGLFARGVDVRGASGEDSGLHGFLVTPSGYAGAADPRRDGTAVAEPVQ
jgi:gamma-glutamyltranspeptidase/glutathione hydrolase